MADITHVVVVGTEGYVWGAIPASSGQEAWEIMQYLERIDREIVAEHGLSSASITSVVVASRDQIESV